MPFDHTQYIRNVMGGVAFETDLFAWVIHHKLVNYLQQ